MDRGGGGVDTKMTSKSKEPKRYQQKGNPNNITKTKQLIIPY